MFRAWHTRLRPPSPRSSSGIYNYESNENSAQHFRFRFIIIDSCARHVIIEIIIIIIIIIFIGWYFSTTYTVVVYLPRVYCVQISNNWFKNNYTIFVNFISLVFLLLLGNQLRKPFSRLIFCIFF